MKPAARRVEPRQHRARDGGLREPGARPRLPRPLSPASRPVNSSRTRTRFASTSCWRWASKRKGAISTTALFVSPWKTLGSSRHELALRELSDEPGGAAPRRAHRAVAAHLHLRLAERRGHEPREAHEIERAHPAELHLAAHDRVRERAAERQRRGLLVLREVEAGHEHAHRARGLVQRVEAARPQLERRLARVARDDAQRDRLGIAVAACT